MPAMGAHRLSDASRAKTDTDCLHRGRGSGFVVTPRSRRCSTRPAICNRRCRSPPTSNPQAVAARGLPSIGTPRTWLRLSGRPQSSSSVRSGCTTLSRVRKVVTINFLIAHVPPWRAPPHLIRPCRTPTARCLDRGTRRSPCREPDRARSLPCPRRRPGASARAARGLRAPRRRMRDGRRRSAAR